ncbi:MAG TPA: aminotransferase class V-fold PLP-dependent enzyme [Pyrinomonadaceae bacterium]|nr:aminotransferase class V-fold PLP-dependent enzyme [Chloracidobacterium sp.]HRJ90363.1 aminotransferase class V-fold PLP-dependent enzyme [Pyrinomonadaceae bacterium]HRK52131.1 aminotransferase class V-fold PLP-dependent enzyme [Pyrinomonadaceae bacterium]
MASLSRRDLLRGAGAALGAVALDQSTSASAEQLANEYGFAPGLIYLNTGSLGPTPRSTLDAVMKAWTELETNPVAMSYGAGAVHALADKTRGAIAGIIGCTADEILLTRSTTNAMTTAGLGIDLDRGDRVLTTDVEHEGGSAVWKHLEKRRGVIIDRVSIPSEDHDVKGIVGRFAAAIRKETKVISVSHVITSTGLRMPVREIVALAKAKNILTIVDGAQAVGNIEVDVKAIGCDAYAAPGHKWLLAPKGTGFLYINKDSATKIQPVEWTDGKAYVLGSAGMGSLPLIVGLGAAIEAAQKRGIVATEARNLALRNLAYEGLKKIAKAQVVSAPPGPLATALVAFKLPDAIDSSAFRNTMRQKYNLMLKQTEKRWGNGMRISPHVFNTEADIDAALKAIAAELA